jgi:hypothetical protein
MASKCDRNKYHYLHNILPFKESLSNKNVQQNKRFFSHSQAINILSPSRGIENKFVLFLPGNPM